MRRLAGYVRLVDRLNYRLGRVAMYLLFAMMAILFWSSLSKIMFRPSLWTLEMAQFVMVGYYMIGGPYSLQFSERSYSVWQPYMWPVKLVMVVGIILMLLQSLAELARDILTLRGHPLPPRPSPVIGGSGNGRQEG